MFLSRQPLDTFSTVLEAAEPRPSQSAPREAKKNYAQRLSEAFAVLIANELREYFPNILPTADGRGTESPARTGKGVKKLDVNYSTPDLGLGLGISVKTLNFPDPKTKRYTKNPTRLDNELRAEAMDYHDRQPYSVLVALVLVPIDACHDGDPSRKTSSSSFAQIVSVLRHRMGRKTPRDDAQLFELGFVGLYQHDGDHRGHLRLFDLNARPPQFGVPRDTEDLDTVLKRITAHYDARNTVRKPWEADEKDVAPFKQLLETDQIPAGDESDDEGGV